jgi:hypothetical protein
MHKHEIHVKKSAGRLQVPQRRRRASQQEDLSHQKNYEAYEKQLRLK